MNAGDPLGALIASIKPIEPAKPIEPVKPIEPASPTSPISPLAALIANIKPAEPEEQTPGPTTPTGLKHYSVSSIALATQCPKSWWLKYGDDGVTVPRMYTQAANFGSQYDTLISARLGLGEGLSHYDLKEPGVDKAVDSYFKQKHAMTSATDAQLMIEIMPDQWAAICRRYGLNLAIDRPIIGYIDLWDGKAKRIVDLKTSTSKRMTPDWALQLLIYSLAMNAKAAEIHLLARTKKPTHYRFTVPLTEENYRWAIVRFTYAAQLISHWLRKDIGDFLPQLPDYYCSWCPGFNDCPAPHLFTEDGKNVAD